jgi:hypothetical protein
MVLSRQLLPYRFAKLSILAKTGTPAALKSCRVFHSPRESQTMMVKRLIATAGQKAKADNPVPDAARAVDLRDHRGCRELQNWESTRAQAT